jgi:hypothetical protein
MDRYIKCIYIILVAALAVHAAAAAAPTYGCRRVSASSLNVRETPCATGKLITTLPNNAWFHYTGTAQSSSCGDSNRWIRIIWNQRPGWVSSGVPGTSNFVVYCPLFKQYPLTPFPTSSKDFINKVAPGAVTGMWVTNVPASVSIAQAILESGWGSSKLATQANNLFGIKGTGNCGSVTMPTKEIINGEEVIVNAVFRKYCSFGDSIVDHGYFFLENPRYQNAMKNSGNADEFARQIQRAGYATDPNYAQKLINLINQYSLRRWDLVLA